VFDEMLRCHHCGFEYVHIQGTRIVDADYEISRDVRVGRTVDLRTPEGSSPYRGGFIEIKVDCENSCPPFYIVYGIHKGNIFTSTAPTPV
jgi:hypothetical protein